MTHPSARPFTAKELETIKTMWEQGHSGSVIGAALKRSRCSILGKLARLGIKGRRAAVQIQRATKVPKAEAKETRHKGADAYRILHAIRTRQEVATRIAAVAPKLPKSRIVPGSKPVTLFERTGCCFPVNEGGPFLFCDQPLHGRVLYCDAHLGCMTAAGVAG
jgi:hypothetical protein